MSAAQTDPEVGSEPGLEPGLKSASVPGGLFFGLLSLGSLAVCAALAAGLLYSADWPAVAALREAYHWQPRAYSRAEFEGLRQGLAWAAGGLALLGLGLGGTAASRREGRAWADEWRQLRRGLVASWRALRPGERRAAWVVLAALTALRLGLSLYLEPYDDAVSYELFVRADSWLAAAAFYPLPNNHVASSLLDQVFYRLHPGFWWSMRLPVLLVSTGATAAWFWGLVRARVGFWAALLAAGWFGLMQVGLYHAAMGRGYWLLVGLAGLGFFALLDLTRPRPSLPVPQTTPAGASVLAVAFPARAFGQPRLAWATLVGGGMLGLFTVPTHAYFLFSAYGWLLWQSLRRRDKLLGSLALGFGGVTLLGAGLLYSPLLLVSGPANFLDNEYVQPLAWAEFGRGLPHYVWWSEGWLVGHRWLGLGPGLVALALGWHWGRTGLNLADRRLVGLALWLVITPYALVLVQRVQAPERTLFYKAQFSLLLLALLTDAGLRRASVAAGRVPRMRWLLAGSVLYAGLNLGLVLRSNRYRQLTWAPFEAASDWLATQPAGGPMWVPGPGTRLGLRFYLHYRYHERPWQLDSKARPGVRYRFVVLLSGSERPPQLRQAPVRWQQGSLVILEVP